MSGANGGNGKIDMGGFVGGGGEGYPNPAGTGIAVGAGGAGGSGEIVQVIGYQVGVDEAGRPVLYRLEAVNLWNGGRTRAVVVPGGIERFGMPGGLG